MKKILYTMLVALAATCSFTSCEDVPAPYDMPNGGGNDQPNLPEDVIFTADLTSSLGDFKSQSAEGEIAWKIDHSSACITGYADWDGSGTKTNKAGVTYLVSPEIDLTGVENAYLEVSQAMRYEYNDINANNSFLVSTDYAGDVKTATWKQLQYDASKLTQADFTFVTSAVNLPSDLMGKKITVAFRHTCAAKSSTWEIQKVSVKKGSVETPDTPDTPDTPAGTPAGTGTKDDPFNVAAANKYISDGGDATKEVYVKGIVSELKEYRSNYGSISYYISEDGTTANQFYVYGGNNLGNTKFTKLEDLKVGDKVVICGKLKNYGGTNEFDSRNYLVSLNGKTESGSTGGEDKPATSEGLTLDSSKGIVTMVNSGVAEGESVTFNVKDMGLSGDDTKGVVIDAITLSDGTKISFVDNGESNKPTFFQKYGAIRIYKNNGFTITGKSKIAKVVFTCDGTQYVGNETATLSFSGNDVSYKNVFTGTSGGGVQLRFKAITITYAK